MMKSAWVAVLSILCCLLVRTAHANQYATLHVFQNATGRQAVCNDGSPAGFYVRKGTGSNANNWIVHLQGGYWAWDGPSALKRAVDSPKLVSSAIEPWPEQIGTGGMLSPYPVSNPMFAGYSMAYVPYCTSDGWSGTISRGFKPTRRAFLTDVGQWSFSGKAVIQAVFEDLRDYYGMEDNNRLLFSGCSAGGQGVLVNMDFVSRVVRSVLGFHNTRIRGVADAGWLLDAQPYNPQQQPLSEQIAGAMSMWGAKFNRNCTAVLSKREAWRCFFGEYVFPFISTPLFVHAEQFDLFQLPYNGINTYPPTKSSAQRWLGAFRKEFITTIGASHAAYSPACHWHCSTEGKEWNTIQIGNVSMRAAVESWYSQDGLVPNVLVDTCEGLTPCSNGCPDR